MPFRPIRILLVEDEAAHAEAIRRSLEGMEGAELRVVTTLREFQDQAVAWNPHIALMDLNLPDGNATELLANSSGDRDFPVVVMTSFGSEHTAVQAMKSGALDYLVKSPETFNGLPITLGLLLREWQLQSDAKQMQLDLKESEEKFRSLTESISDFIMRYDRKGRHTYLNPAALQMLGRTSSEILFKTHFECGFPEHLCHFWEGKIEEVFQTGQSSQMEFEFQGPFGPVTHDWRLTPELDTDGVVFSVLGVSRDITERKQAEKDLVQSRAELKAIYDHVPVMMCVIDPDRRVIYANQAFTTFTGVSEADLKGGKFGGTIGCIHALDDPDGCGIGTNCRDCPIRKAMDDTLQTGIGHQNIEYSANLIQGVDIKEFVFLGSTALFNEGNQKQLLLCLNDITDRKIAEEALLESEKRFRSYVSNSPVGVFICDETGRYLEVNPAASAITGFSEEELLGMSIPDLLPAEARETGIQGFRDVVETGHSVVELGFNHKTGFTRYWSVEAVRLSSNKFLGFASDISKRKQSESENLRLQDQLHHAQKMESLGNLAGGVAHDMNNVLGAILGLASANIEAQPVGSPAQHAFKTIIKAAERGGKMVKGLLSFARQSPAEEKDLDLNTILLEEVHLLERTTLSRVNLETDLASNLRCIRGDASALAHAFMNLCVNAKDAMHDGGTLTLRSRNLDNNWIQAEVEDTGSGMSNDVLARALDPFFTTKEVGKGTGLGLSMVYSTVKAHQGLIDIESELGRGTCVRIRFPISNSMIQTSDSSNLIPLTTSSRALNILVVDDDELIQSTMVAMLEILCHGVTTAWSGEEALVRLEGGLASDAVILDMNMPGLGGDGTLPRLRALHPTLPVFLATGRVDESALQLTRKYPQVTLLSKPFSMMELQQHLSALG